MDTSRIHNTMDNLSQLLGYTTPDRVDEGTGHDGVDLDHCDRKKGGTNVLLYGVPGSGKSYTIQHEYCSDENRMERLVFHPDYTYSDRYCRQYRPMTKYVIYLRPVHLPDCFGRHTTIQILNIF